MAKFSDRMRITQSPTELQIQDINQPLRNSLWNLLAESFDGDWTAVTEGLCVHYYKEALDTLPEADFTDDLRGSYHKRRTWLHEKFMQAAWYEVYNLVEYVLQNTKTISHKYEINLSLRLFEKELNKILERELAGYRAINGVIVPITAEHEVEAIRQAASVSSLGFAAASQHIATALHLLGKKPEPDYRNSIKESISAVESICKVLTDEKSGGLSKALTELSKKAALHQALKNAFVQLYSYTSDENGIRHAILEEEGREIGFAEAKFMLVACSAFVNFIIDKARQANML